MALYQLSATVLISE